MHNLSACFDMYTVTSKTEIHSNASCIIIQDEQSFFKTRLQHTHTIYVQVTFIVHSKYSNSYVIKIPRGCIAWFTFITNSMAKYVVTPVTITGM